MKFTYSFLWILSLCFFSCATTVGQPPEAVAEAFAAQYPDEDSPEWSRDSNGYYEAKFKKDGTEYRADYSPEGEWIETENSVDYSDLPEAVQDRIKADYDKDEISEIEKVDHPSKGTFYDVEFGRKGPNLDVLIAPDGTVLDKDR